MEELFVPHDLTLELKKSGFKCKQHFKEYDTEGYLQHNELLSSHNLEFIEAPLWDQVFQWFEEKYGLSGEVQKQAPYKGMSFTYWWYLIQNNKGEDVTDWNGRYNDILEKSSQDIEGNYVNDEKLEKHIVEDKFGFKTRLEAKKACLEKLIEIAQKTVKNIGKEIQ